MTIFNTKAKMDSWKTNALHFFGAMVMVHVLNRFHLPIHTAFYITIIYAAAKEISDCTWLETPEVSGGVKGSFFDLLWQIAGAAIEVCVLTFIK